MRRERNFASFIKPQELDILVHALEDRGELVFPLPDDVVAVLIAVSRKAQAGRLGLWWKAKAIFYSWWNASFASLFIFLITVDFQRVEVEAVSTAGRSGLRVKAKSNTSVEPTA